MALTVTVTKKSVTLRQQSLYSISVNMKMLDGAVEVINRDYSVEYRTGDSVPAKETELMTKMQGDIDKYKAEQLIFTDAGFTTVVSNLQSGLTV
jgi:hypothetical protein